MHLYAESPNRLILDMSQWGWRLRGLLLMIIGLIGFIFMDVHYRIDCSQKSPGVATDCQLQSRAYGFQVTRTSLGALKRAAVVYQGKDVNTLQNLYIIKLDTSSGLVNLTDGPSVGAEEKNRIANAINTYVNLGVDPRFSVPYSNTARILMQTIFGILFLIGLIILLGTNYVLVTLDTTSNDIIVIRRRWFSQKEKHFKMSEVVQFNVQEMNFSFRTNVKLCRIVVLLSNLHAMPLTRAYSTNCKAVHETVDKINIFLTQKNT